MYTQNIPDTFQLLERHCIWFSFPVLEPDFPLFFSLHSQMKETIITQPFSSVNSYDYFYFKSNDGINNISYSNDLEIWIPPNASFCHSHTRKNQRSFTLRVLTLETHPQLVPSPRAAPAGNSPSESPRQLLKLRINLLWGEDLRDTDGLITGVQLSGRPCLAQFTMCSNLFQLQGSKAVTPGPGEGWCVLAGGHVQY